MRTHEATKVAFVVVCVPDTEVQCIGVYILVIIVEWFTRVGPPKE